MVRTQILLEESQHHFLKETAERRGDSMSSLIREAVDLIRAEIEREENKRRALGFLGRFEADRSDIAVHHDWYLAGLEPPTTKNPA